MDKTIFDYLIAWLALHEEWRQMLYCGANAPRRTDGQMLNGIRNRMIYLLSDMRENGYSMEDMLREAPAYGLELDEEARRLPPEMSIQYMKDGEAIKETAEKALAIYKDSPDYLYIQENMVSLDEKEDAHILERLKSDTDFVRILCWMIQKERLPEMRKYSDVPYYLDQLHRARKLLEMRISCICPFT